MLRRRSIALALALVLVNVTTTAPAWATPQHMSKLPATTPFRCLNCHTESNPTNGTLNSFGQDFVANGLRWDRILAQKHSDGDSCTNGFEIGDQDGDGRLDEGVVGERHNPGEPDCTLQLSPQAWSALKTLFR